MVESEQVKKRTLGCFDHFLVDCELYYTLYSRDYDIALKL